MTPQKFTFSKKSLAVFVGLLAATPAFHAQAASESLIEEVVVTAQRREQSLLDVPIAVSSYSAEALEEQGIEDLLDLNKASPSIFINVLQNPTLNVPVRIRGIGTSGSNPGFESATGVYVDGVYRSRPGTAMMGFTDLEALEVLRGPQGTLFGKNTTAGALQMKTKAPVLGEQSGNIALRAGNFNTYDIEAAVNIAVNDSTALRFSGLYSESDGQFEDPVTGEDDVAFQDNQVLRAQIASAVSDRLYFRLVADWGEFSSPIRGRQSTRIDSQDVDGLQNTVYGPAALNLFGPVTTGSGYWYWDITTPGAQADPFAYENSVNRETYGITEQYGATLNVEYDLNDTWTLTSISGWREIEDRGLIDSDFGPTDLSGGLIDTTEISTISQEFLFAGNLDFSGGQTLDLVLGGNYYHEEIDIYRASRGTDGANFFFSTLLLLGTPSVDVNALGVDALNSTYLFQNSTFFQEEDSIGLFAHATYSINDQLSVIGGVRYNNIQKDGGSVNLSGSPAEYWNGVFRNSFLLIAGGVATNSPDFEGEVDESEFTYDISLQYRPNDDSQIYVKYSRGYKAGGVNLQNDGAGQLPILPTAFDPSQGHVLLEGLPFSAPSDTVFDPEFVDAYEIGYRTEYLGRGRLSATIFYMDFEDLQVNVFDGQVFSTFNAASSETSGLELENTFAVNENLRLNMALTYLDTQYGDRSSDESQISTEELRENLALGRERGQAPELAVTLGAFYEQNINADMAFFANVNYSWYDEMFLSEDGNDPGGFQLADLTQDAYGVWGATLGLRSTLGTWEASFWCRNCADEEYFDYAFNHVFHGASILANPGQRRSFGLEVRRYFE